MKLERLAHDPAALVDFFQAGLEHLGAVCERTWYDRVQLVAEGRAARLWNNDGALLETELSFPPAGDTAPRAAAIEVFPGCPLTFRLAETLRPQPLPLERGFLEVSGTVQPPTAKVAEKLWQAQRPGGARWRLDSPFVHAHHFSLVALVRCEIQAIDQHWSLRRLALSLLDGEPDPTLAAEFGLARLVGAPEDEIPWPSFDRERGDAWLHAALDQELATDLSAIRQRQENYLRRELDRVDEYFEHYEAELTARTGRSASAAARSKISDRLAAAKAEHVRRRHDQVQRHEIRVIPHFDALLLLAEPAWRATVCFHEGNQPHRVEATFLPRSRCWKS